jgi:hypothetical protein
MPETTVMTIMTQCRIQSPRADRERSLSPSFTVHDADGSGAGDPPAPRPGPAPAEFVLRHPSAGNALIMVVR